LLRVEGGVLRQESGEREYDAYGCVQIANANSDCVGPLVLPLGTLAITENDTWKALRIGMSGAAAINFPQSFRGAFQQAGAFVQASYNFSMPAGGTLVDTAR
jgi:hypothetical protein